MNGNFLPVRPWERKLVRPPTHFVAQDLQSSCHDDHWLILIDIDCFPFILKSPYLSLNPDEDYIKMTVVCSTSSMTNICFSCLSLQLWTSVTARWGGSFLRGQGRDAAVLLGLTNGLTSKHGEKTSSILDITTSLFSLNGTMVKGNISQWLALFQVSEIL